MKLPDPPRQPLVRAHRACSRFDCAASPGWRRTLLDVQAAHNVAGAPRPHVDARSGRAERVRLLRCFKGCTLVVAVGLLHRVHNPHPGIRQRPNGFCPVPVCADNSLWPMPRCGSIARQTDRAHCARASDTRSGAWHGDSSHSPWGLGRCPPALAPCGHY